MMSNALKAFGCHRNAKVDQVFSMNNAALALCLRFTMQLAGALDGTIIPNNYLCNAKPQPLQIRVISTEVQSYVQ
jgi:hypothetical protein